jgi:lipopolysaccharide/colanic/teichoic acid biosynthesis glycosyltransferase
MEPISVADRFDEARSVSLQSLPTTANVAHRAAAPPAGDFSGFDVARRRSWRAFDRSVAALALVVLAVPFFVVMLATKLTSPGPIFFRQVRIGRFGRRFRIYKFRSMPVTSTPDADFGFGLPGTVTPVGRFLRRSKIDELPQLINVLVGDMNLVGPRPEIPEFVAKYPSADKRIVLSVAPGLTDFASIRFRNEEQLLARQSDRRGYYEQVLMPAKLRYCRFYVGRASFALDLYLIGRTFLVLGRDLMGSIGGSAAQDRR